VGVATEEEDVGAVEMVTLGGGRRSGGLRLWK